MPFSDIQYNTGFTMYWKRKFVTDIVKSWRKLESLQAIYTCTKAHARRQPVPASHTVVQPPAPRHYLAESLHVDGDLKCTQIYRMLSSRYLSPAYVSWPLGRICDAGRTKP